MKIKAYYSAYMCMHTVYTVYVPVAESYLVHQFKHPLNLLCIVLERPHNFGTLLRTYIQCPWQRLLHILHTVHVLSHLCSGELPLKVIQSESADATDGPSDASLTKTFPMVTLEQWYVLNHGVHVHISLPSFYTIL